MDELTPEFTDKEDERLFKAARLGEVTRTFLDSELGQALLLAAKQQIDDAAFELLKTPAWRTRKIRRIQMDAEVASSFPSWCNDIINAGEYAHQGLLMKKAQQEQEI